MVAAFWLVVGIAAQVVFWGYVVACMFRKDAGDGWAAALAVPVIVGAVLASFLAAVFG